MNTAPYSMRAIDGSPHVGREAFDAQQRIVDAERLLDRVDLVDPEARRSEWVALVPTLRGRLKGGASTRRPRLLF